MVQTLSLQTRQLLIFQSGDVHDGERKRNKTYLHCKHEENSIIFPSLSLSRTQLWLKSGRQSQKLPVKRASLQTSLPEPLLMEDVQVPRIGVGVGVFIIRGKHVLLGKRLPFLGKSYFCPPGGHLEFGESWEECAKREVKEETGLDVEKVEFVKATNIVLPHKTKPKHYVTIYMRCVMVDEDQKPENLEPEKCEGWEWHEWPNLPKPLFQHLQDMIDNGVTPFEGYGDA